MEGMRDGAPGLILVSSTITFGGTCQYSSKMEIY
jgi:hypothetical protein